MTTLKQIRSALTRLAETDDKAKFLLQLWTRVETAQSVDGTAVAIGSILSGRTKAGMVELVVGAEVLQLELDKAREIHGMLGGAIEAAVSDEIVYLLLTEKVGLDDGQASRVLLDLRELRQGSRGTVHPS